VGFQFKSNVKVNRLNSNLTDVKKDKTKKLWIIL
jgi:hypothetical protein